MSKTNVTRPRRAARRSRPSPQAGGMAPPAGHSYVALLGIQTFDTASLLERVREGIAYSSWERFLQSTGLTKEGGSRLIQITPRTLARRKEEGRLQPDESDRLLRAARIFSQAVDLFEGDDAAARRWLTGPQPALGGSTPWEYAASEIGAREVENLIGRLEHGIPS